MILTTWTGRENAEEAQAAINAFWVPSRARTGQETFIGNAVKSSAVSGVSLLNKAAPHNARRTVVNHDAGQWHRAVYEVADGVLIKITVVRKQAWSSMRVQSHFIIHAREEAPLYRIEIPLSGHKDMNFSSHEISGRFDILSFEEAKILGAPLQDFARSSFDPVRMARAVTVIMQERETAPRITLRVRETVNARGDTVSVTEPIRRRGLRIG